MLNQNLQASLKTALSMETRQSLQILEAPLEELSQIVSQQIVINPIFDLDSLDEDFISSSYSPEFVSSFSKAPSLLETLQNQVDITFQSPLEHEVASYIIGSLSPQGFLEISLEEIQILTGASVQNIQQILEIIKQFSPKGVASKNQREYWLYVLSPSQNPITYAIIRDDYPNLIACNFYKIAQKYSLPAQQIAPLLESTLRKIPWDPASVFSSNPSFKGVQPAIPDIYLEKRKELWHIQINKKGFESLKINQEALEIFQNENSNQEIKNKLLEAKQLLRSLKRREQTLLRLMEFMIPIQENFLLGKDAAPVPCSPHEASQALDVHVSTIFRAIENKSISCPSGIISLKKLFSSPQTSLKTCSDKIVHAEQAKLYIRDLVAEETKPLSDSELSQKLLAMGIVCARRTVSKYREGLHILPANKRRHFKTKCKTVRLLK